MCNKNPKYDADFIKALSEKLNSPKFLNSTIVDRLQKEEDREWTANFGPQLIEPKQTADCQAQVAAFFTGQRLSTQACAWKNGQGYKDPRANTRYILITGFYVDEKLQPPPVPYPIVSSYFNGKSKKFLVPRVTGQIMTIKVKNIGTIPIMWSGSLHGVCHI